MVFAVCKCCTISKYITLHVPAKDMVMELYFEEDVLISTLHREKAQAYYTVVMPQNKIKLFTNLRKYASLG